MRVFAIVGVRVDLSQEGIAPVIHPICAVYAMGRLAPALFFGGEILRAALGEGRFLQSNTRLCFKHAPVSHRNGPRSAAKLVHVVNGLCAFREALEGFYGLRSSAVNLLLAWGRFARRQ